ncbi:class I SAM-dependent methyltransferase [Rathayibacter sp. ZW T2_19]|uniref:Class I SAM-dependent methyltransferase n=1 Tax=Rathayibacter rubneri TaxID=2950106 RepID=A0A9X2E1Q2_9MICO|nr:class I SAM-dependent methyltransferase [Rathayibacter rubneri]MCM6762871.1 class I SAM-dependent methyltransferase [Rathayibacter rubneri]
MVQVDRGEHLRSGEWLDLNRALWDERVAAHAGSAFYDLSALRGGAGRLFPVEEESLARVAPGGWEGKRVLHLQCHFGADTLALAQRGAEVIGVDFSMAAVREARGLATELGLADRARFVCANLYELRHMLPEPDSFDVVVTTWGTVVWLPDLVEWARIVEWFLAPGGSFVFVDTHPSAAVLTGSPEGPEPRFQQPYDGGGEPRVVEGAGDYAGTDVAFENDRAHEWSHSLGSIASALLSAGLAITELREEPIAPWRVTPQLVQREDGAWAWPEQEWLPLALAITASKRS